MATHTISAIIVAANFDRPADRVNASEKALGRPPVCDVPTKSCEAHLHDVRNFLSRAPAGLTQLEKYSRNILVSMPFPQQADFVETCLVQPIFKRILRMTTSDHCGKTSIGWQLGRQGYWYDTIRKSVETHPNVSVWSPTEWLCSDGWCPSVINSGERIMDDAIHWSWPAARLIYPPIAQFLDARRIGAGS